MGIVADCWISGLARACGSSKSQHAITGEYSRAGYPNLDVLNWRFYGAWSLDFGISGCAFGRIAWTPNFSMPKVPQPSLRIFGSQNDNDDPCDWRQVKFPNPHWEPF